MYLSDLLMSCLRRWPFFLACLLVSGGLFYLATDAVKPTYAAKASVVLVPPTSTEDPNINRYLGLGGLKQSVDVLVGSMSSDRTTSNLQSRVPGAEFEVVSDLATSAPILDVTATSDTPRAAAAMLKAVLDKIPSTLADLQSSVSIAPQNRITQVVLSSDDEPRRVEKTRYRILGVLGMGLLLTSALLVAALDGLLLRRARRRAPAAAPDAAAEPATTLTEHATDPAGSPGTHVVGQERRKPSPGQAARGRRPVPSVRRTS